MHALNPLPHVDLLIDLDSELLLWTPGGRRRCMFFPFCMTFTLEALRLGGLCWEECIRDLESAGKKSTCSEFKSLLQ